MNYDELVCAFVVAVARSELSQQEDRDSLGMIERHRELVCRLLEGVSAVIYRWPSEQRCRS